MIALKIIAGTEAIIIFILCIALMATLLKRRNDPAEQYERVTMTDLLDKPIGDGPRSRIDKRV